MILSLQRQAGNQAVQKWISKEMPPPPRASTVVQREVDRIEPGKALPDASAIGQKRIEDSKQPEKGNLMKASFLRDLEGASKDDPLINKLIEDRRADMEQLYRRGLQRQFQNDPEGLERALKERVDPTVPDELDILVVKVSLTAYDLEAETSPDTNMKTMEAARSYFAKSKLSDPQKWLAGVLVEYAGTASIQAAEQKIRNDARGEWQQVWSRPEGGSFGHELSSAERKGFARALKHMAPLTALADAHRGKGDSLAVGPDAAKWKDGGWLSDDIQEVNEDDAKKPVTAKDLYRTPIDNGTFFKNVMAADRMLRQLVQGSILSRLDRPKIRVHPMREDRFRAFQSGGEVHLAANEPVQIMVHEVGHYLETKGAISTWADIQKLMLKRHQVAGGGATTEEGPSGMRGEGRFAGAYPVTGKYTSKAYSSGSTEVMSMTVEYLANPKKFNDMVEKDPVQVAVVIRGLQPDLYASQGSLRPFDKFLPS